MKLFDCSAVKNRDTGLSQKKLAALIKEEVLPTLQGRNKQSPDLTFFASQLEKGQVRGMHQWNHISTLLLSYGALLGQNWMVPALFCYQRGLGLCFSQKSS